MARRYSDDQSIALAIPIVYSGYSNERINLGWRQVLSGSPSLLVRRAARRAYCALRRRQCTKRYLDLRASELRCP
jgi:hypothetical protein